MHFLIAESIFKNDAVFRGVHSGPEPHSASHPFVPIGASFTLFLGVQSAFLPVKWLQSCRATSG